MTSKLAFACLFAVGLAAADQPAPDSEVRVVALKHLRGERLRAIATSVRSVLGNDSSLAYDTNLNLVLLRGSPRQIAPIEALLKSADVPEFAPTPDPQAQLRVHLVIASPEAGKDGPLAPEIAAAIDQMRKTFPYKSYRELDTLALQVRDQGRADMDGRLPLETARPDMPATYTLTVMNVAISPDSGSVALRDFRVNLRLPILPNAAAGGASGSVNAFSGAGLKTDVTIRKGQKVVLGKLTSDEHRETVFLVVAADIV